MDLADGDNHQYSGFYPCRLPVWWGRVGDIGPHYQTDGVTGKRVVLRIEKRFTRFERFLAKILRAPREIRRPLDQMNSMLWELCDGSRDFQSICRAMDEVFKENIAPAVDRTASGIDALKSRNLMTILEHPFNQKWNIGPGKTPVNQTLDDLTKKIEYDVEPRTHNEKNLIEAIPKESPPGDRSE